MLLTGAASLVIQILEILQGSPDGVSFYPGWRLTHHSWAPVFVPTSEWTSRFLFVFQIYYDQFVSFVLSLIIFLLFGLTPTARAKYRRWFWTFFRLFGIQSQVIRDENDVMTFQSPPRRPNDTDTRSVDSRHIVSSPISANTYQSNNISVLDSAGTTGISIGTVGIRQETEPEGKIEPTTADLEMIEMQKGRDVEVSREESFNAAYVSRTREERI